MYFSSRMSGKKTHKDVLKNKQIQQRANALLFNRFTGMYKTFPDLLFTIRSEENQDDIGIDFSVELTKITEFKSIQRFSIQNKGIEKGIKILKRTPGFFSYSIGLRNAQYFFQQLNQPLIFTVCDLASGEIYWHPVQLDDEIPDKIEYAIQNKKDSITVHISTVNKINEANFNRFVDDTFKSFREQYFRFQESRSETLFQPQVTFRPDENLAHGEQFVQVLQYYFCDLKYLPPKIWLADPFFSKTKEAYREHEPFLLTTDNLPLYWHFETQNQLDGSDLQVLLWHHLFSIRSTTGRNEFNIKQTFKAVGRPLDHFKHFKWSLVVNELRSVATKSLDSAYLAYLIDDLPMAYEHCWSVQQASKADKNSFRSLIASFNLGKLAKTIRFNYYDHREALAELDIKKAMDLAAIGRRSECNPVVFNYIKEQVFYTQFNNLITNTANSIISGYDNYLRGSSTSNNFVLTLKAAFADLTEFLDSNGIVFSHFLEFHEIADLFAEAMLASHAVDPINNSGLESFDDWTLYHIALYAKTESISNSYYKYSLGKLKYDSVEKPGERFCDLFNNFLTDYESLTRLNSQLDKKLSYRFWENHDTIFSNLCLLFSITDLPADQVSDCISNLVSFLKLHQGLHPRIFTFLKTLFDFRAYDFSKQQVMELLEHFVSTPRFQDDRLIQALIGVIQPGMLSIEESTDVFDLLKTYAGRMRSNEERYGDPEIACILLYERTELQEIRAMARSYVIECLSKKFDDDIYYLSVAYRVLEYDFADFFQQYENYIRTKFNPNSFRMGIVGEDHFHTPFLDKFIDLCLIENLPLNTELCNWIKSLGIFYAWFLEMESFDYESFKPQWIIPFVSTHFQKRITNSVETKNYVRNYLRYNRNPRVEKAALRIFYLGES